MTYFNLTQIKVTLPTRLRLKKRKMEPGWDTKDRKHTFKLAVHDKRGRNKEYFGWPPRINMLPDSIDV